MTEGSEAAPALSVAPHPLLDARAFVTSFAGPLAEQALSPELAALRDAPDDAELEPLLQRDEDGRKLVRDLLRHGGYKPTGRGKPASEYLVRAAGEQGLPQINLAVDACNVVSLHTGLPISVVDLDRARGPFRLALAEPDTRYVFNATGQEIDVSGLLCLWDAEGPCANAVKDSQRTKTHDGTRRTLSVIWGTSALPDRTAAASDWYRALLERAGAGTEIVTPIAE